MGKTPKKSPKKRSDNAKRARPSSTEEEQYGGNEDVLYLELFDLIRTLQAKDKTKEEQLKGLQEQLDQARDEILIQSERKLIINFLKQWKLIFNISANRNGKKLTVSRKMAKILTVSRKKTKILTVNRKSHHPIATLKKTTLCEFWGCFLWSQ